MKVYSRAASRRSTPEQLQEGLLQSSFKKVYSRAALMKVYSIAASRRSTP
jgi:hypothetical protein